MNQFLSSFFVWLGEEIEIIDDLWWLFLFREKVVVVVYKFCDQFGQYWLVEIGVNWLIVVIQGGISIFIKVMDDFGWFVFIEWENVVNLFNECKIICFSWQQYEQNNVGLVFFFLFFVGIILEGGIVFYDVNIVMGGVGFCYFGVGVFGQYC